MDAWSASAQGRRLEQRRREGKPRIGRRGVASLHLQKLTAKVRLEVVRDGLRMAGSLGFRGVARRETPRSFASESAADAPVQNLQ